MAMVNRIRCRHQKRVIKTIYADTCILHIMAVEYLTLTQKPFGNRIDDFLNRFKTLTINAEYEHRDVIFQYSYVCSMLILGDFASQEGPYTCFKPYYEHVQKHKRDRSIPTLEEAQSILKETFNYLVGKASLSLHLNLNQPAENNSLFFQLCSAFPPQDAFASNSSKIILGSPKPKENGTQKFIVRHPFYPPSNRGLMHVPRTRNSKAYTKEYSFEKENIITATDEKVGRCDGFKIVPYCEHFIKSLGNTYEKRKLREDLRKVVSEIMENQQTCQRLLPQNISDIKFAGQYALAFFMYVCLWFCQTRYFIFGGGYNHLNNAWPKKNGKRVRANLTKIMNNIATKEGLENSRYIENDLRSKKPAVTNSDNESGQRTDNASQNASVSDDVESTVSTSDITTGSDEVESTVGPSDISSDSDEVESKVSTSDISTGSESSSDSESEYADALDEERSDDNSEVRKNIQSNENPDSDELEHEYLKRLIRKKIEKCLDRITDKVDGNIEDMLNKLCDDVVNDDEGRVTKALHLTDDVEKQIRMLTEAFSSSVDEIPEKFDDLKIKLEQLSAILNQRST